MLLDWWWWSSTGIASWGLGWSSSSVATELALEEEPGAVLVLEVLGESWRRWKEEEEEEERGG